VLRLGLSARVIMRRLPIGVSLAWMFIVLTFPFMGAIAYLFIGELRLGHRRAIRSTELQTPFHRWRTQLSKGDVDWSKHPASAEALARMCETTIGIPARAGNHVEFLTSSEQGLVRLIKDIDEAQKTCHLEFYIWAEGGLADEVGNAVLRAAKRGVICRILLDDVGSREFLRSEWADRFREGCVAMQPALLARIWRLPFVRFDLRLHRKIAVIDGSIAYTGSMNLVDSRFFKQSAGVGKWIDAAVRVEGPAVQPMAITFLGDWAQESEESVEQLRETGGVCDNRPVGQALVQVIPSGPAQAWATIERIVIATIYSATKRVILTTPYFVPDEAMMAALITAAQRGVDVTLILPERVDSRLAWWASRANQGDLVASGVKVLLFRGGLLHTKSIAVDGEYSLFGSLNLDPRSLHLNFEITLAIYDAAFTAELEQLQAEYAAESHVLNLAEWQARGRIRAFIENAARLLGPLL
jgi:cardiolipin synthase